MTQLDVVYRYGIAPTEAKMMAIARLREVYGIRKLDVHETAQTLRVEYDATRLTEAVVHQMLRRAGLDIVERVALIAPPAPAPEPPAAAAV